MKPIIYLLISSMCIAGCSKHPLMNKPFEKESLAREATIKTALKLKKEKELIPCGTGGGMMDQIRMLALSFDYRKPIDIDKGRELLVTAVNTFVDEVNGIEEIHPYLANDPFLPKNIQIRIFLRNADGSNPAPGEFAVISCINGILEYEIDDPNNPFRLETIYKETYEEAVQKLQASNVSSSDQKSPK